MNKKVTLSNSSLGQKVLVGLTGLFLCTFLVVHLSGNLLLFRRDGGRAFEDYAHFMATNPAIRTMEIVLFAGFVAHIAYATRVWLANRRARPAGYAMSRPEPVATLASRTMHWTGAVVLIFLIVHLNSFFVPSRFAAGAAPSMYELVEHKFSSPVYSGFYVLAMALLGYHLRHGFQSAFQTFGVRPGQRRMIDLVALFFWLVIPIGFAAMPVYFLWTQR